MTHHTLFRKETRLPGYYNRADHMKLDDPDWHCFTLSDGADLDNFCMVQGIDDTRAYNLSKEAGAD